MNLNIFTKLLATGYFFTIAAFFSTKEYTLTYLLILNISFLICILIFVIPKIPKYLFFSLLLSICLEFIYLLPNAPNHRHVLFFVAMITFFSLGKESLFQQKTLPALRCLTILVYFFAFFSKLNWSYLEPKNSCSVLFYGNILKTFPFFPKGELVDYFVIYTSILLEALLPLFLIIRPAWGLLLGVLFHSALALDIYKYFINFSSVMFICLSSFIDKNIVHKFFSQRRKIVSLSLPFFLIGVVSIIGAEYYNDLVLNHSYGPSFLVKYIFWYGFATYILYIVFFLLTRSGLNYCFKNKLHFPELIIIFLVLINGLSPYLGLKTRTSFNMYSNMQMTSKDSNHIVIPKSLDMFDYLKDFEENAKKPEGVLAKKLLLFRSIDLKSERECVW